MFYIYRETDHEYAPRLYFNGYRRDWQSPTTQSFVPVWSPDSVRVFMYKQDAEAEANLHTDVIYIGEL